ncbi:A disintegrin and metalloproteinase with thrombospondin motifs 6 [Nymphon striatum]|nr:A disintegrin and metalloproteinase with thrombospondin motifs 6 [Nymphon striatum]
MYKLNIKNHDYQMNLTLNENLVSSTYIMEKWKNGSSHMTSERAKSCHYFGHLINEKVSSSAAVSNCHGLNGFFSAGRRYFFIEPLHNLSTINSREGVEPGVGQPHIVYETSSITFNRRKACGTPDPGEKHDTLLSDMSREDEEKSIYPKSENKYRKHFGLGKRRSKRSISEDYYVETLVVSDAKMTNYHGLDNVESYILTLMNIVSQLYKDESIGNSINIVVVRIIALVNDEPGLNTGHNAKKTLSSFCRWQKIIRKAANSANSVKLGVPQHDNAILLTRYDICFNKDQPCDTLGLAHVSGMCVYSRSCSIAQDIGLSSAFTVAHEIGHNQGTCLTNKPTTKRQMKLRSVLPGEKFTANDQCRLQYGRHSRHCPQVGTACNALWCYNRLNTACVTNNIPILDGTSCGLSQDKKGWCYNGQCIRHGIRPKPVDGGWGPWSTWSSCSRSCGGGIETSSRKCVNPRPQNKGKYCTGTRHRYRSCNIHDCSSNSTDFRTVQCNDFGRKRFRDKLYKWKPYANYDTKSCTLFCQAVGFDFYVKRASRVIDGTPCRDQSVCVRGRCRRVGCDRLIRSNATMDKCGICGGNGTLCKPVSGQVDDHLLYNLNCRESSGKYLINGDWIIDWPKKVFVNGSIITYSRHEEKPESISINGPTTVEFDIFLLVQEENSGIRYSYNNPLTLNHSQDIFDNFFWNYSSIRNCSSGCDKGKTQILIDQVKLYLSNNEKFHSFFTLKMGTKVSIFQQILVPFCKDRRNGEVLSNTVCRSTSQPPVIRRPCFDRQCYRQSWSVGNWSECSAECGKNGFRRRNITCMTHRGTVSTPIKCYGKKPFTKRPCRGVVCPEPSTNRSCVGQDCQGVWATGPWAKCNVTCGYGHISRIVQCFTPSKTHQLPEIRCLAASKPVTALNCRGKLCRSSKWMTGKWGKCDTKCEKGYQGNQVRQVKCQSLKTGFRAMCLPNERPTSVRPCTNICNHNTKESALKAENICSKPGLDLDYGKP